MVVGNEKMANNHSRLHYVSLAFLNTDLDTDFTVPGAVSRGRWVCLFLQEKEKFSLLCNFNKLHSLIGFKVRK